MQAVKKILSFAVLTFFIIFTIILSCDKDNNIIDPGEDTYTISGKVVNTGGTGSRNITITIIGTGVEESTITDSLGTYSFDGLLTGEYTITPLRERLIFPTSTEVSITDSNVEVDNFYLSFLSKENSDESVIVGKILDSDTNPISEVVVKVITQPFDPKRGGSGYTNRYGFYLASGSRDSRIIRNESYMVVPNKNWYNYTFSPDTSYVTPTEMFTEVNFTATYHGEPLHSISGRIVDTDGNGVYSNFIYIHNEENILETYFPSTRISTDIDGFYRFSELKDGKYIFRWVISSGIGAAQVTIIETVILDGEDVIMPDQVNIYIGSTKYVFSGKVLDSEGNGIPGVKVSFPMIGDMVTDAEGFYTTGDKNFQYRVDTFDSKKIFIIPSKSGFSFIPDTTYVTYEWQKGVEFAELVVPDIIGFDWGIYTAEDYFPLNPGSAWTYMRTVDNGEPYDHNVSVIGTETQNGTTYSQMSTDFPGDFNTYRIEDNNVYALSDGEEKLFLKFGLPSGTEWIIDYIRVYTCKTTFLGAETIEVTAGTFTDCLHFEAIITYGATSYESLNMWFARDIGLARAVKVIVSYDRLVETITDELKEYDVE